MNGLERRIGTLRPRPVSEISGSNWTLGCETLDYQQYGGFDVRGLPFREPVYCELISGEVYELPEGAFHQEGDVALFREIPLWDSPVVIAEKSILALA